MQLDSNDRDKLIEILGRIPDLKERRSKETFCIKVFGDTDTSRIAKLIADTGKDDFAILVLADVQQIKDPGYIRRCYEEIRSRTENQKDREWLNAKLKGFSDEAFELFKENDLILNPYLIDQGLIDRDEEKDLDTWLMENPDPNDRFLCITDFGGAGKTALVWKWLNSKKVLGWRHKQECHLFWSTFYARNYNSLDFLRKIAIKLQLDGVDSAGTPHGGDDVRQPIRFRQAWSTLITSIVNKLARTRARWLIVLDGLEREMGMYADPSNQAYDSQAQDTRKETERDSPNRFHPDYDIRSAVFTEFLDTLVRKSNESVRLIATSRLMPNNVPKYAPPEHVGFREMPLRPLDSERLWKSITSLIQADELAKKFFNQVDHHPQIVSIVAAAFVESGQETFGAWLESIDEQYHFFLQELDQEQRLTNRRHRWLDIATRDLVRKPLLWGLLCRVACNPGESSIRSLHNTAQKLSGGEVSWDYGKTESTLEKLKERRLVGVGTHAMESAGTSRNVSQFVDVHPVVRCHIYQYAVRLHRMNPLTYNESERLIHGVIKQAESDSGLFLGLVDQRNYEERLLQIQDVHGTSGPRMDGSKNFDRIWNDYFARFYPNQDSELDPRMLMPAMRVRKNQGYISLQSAHLFTVTGRWQASMQAYRIAEMAYAMAGDLESSLQTRRGRTWQQLYGGSLLEFEKYFVDRYNNDRERWNPQSDPYWLAIGMAVRCAPETARLLKSIEQFAFKGGVGWTRWQAQTVAECWYYLAEKPEDYERPVRMIEALKDEARDDGPIQRVWETLTQGICFLGQGNTGSAGIFVQDAWENAINKNDAVTSSFAQAYMVELEAGIAQRERDNGEYSRMIAAFERARNHLGKYQQRDQDGRFQIPATIANLGFSRACLVAARDSDKELIREAQGFAQEAARIAAGAHPRFGFGLGLSRAKQTLAEIDQKMGDDSDRGDSSILHSISEVELVAHEANLGKAIDALLQELAS